MNSKNDEDLYLDALVDDVDENNDYYKYTEVEHEGPKNDKDCAIRAISLATHKPYETVQKELATLGATFKKSYNDYNILNKYLEIQGWKDSDIILKPYGGSYTVGEFCEVIQHRDLYNKEFEQEVPMDKEIIVDCVDSEDLDDDGEQIPGTPTHLTYIKNGVVHDNRDCYDYMVYSYWSKK